MTHKHLMADFIKKPGNLFPEILIYFFAFLLIYCPKNIQAQENDKARGTSEYNSKFNFTYILDFNGDGIKDTIKLIDLSKFIYPQKYNDVNPWSENKIIPDEKLAFIITVSKSKDKYIVHDFDFLSTPSWLQDSLPVRVLTTLSPEYKEWKAQVPKLKKDALVLGTEAGIDILLYWDGKTFKLFWPDEEP